MLQFALWLFLSWDIKSEGLGSHACVTNAAEDACWGTWHPRPRSLKTVWLRVSWRMGSGVLGRVADVCDYSLAYVLMLSSVATMFVIRKVPFSKVEPMGRSGYWKGRCLMLKSACVDCPITR